MDRFVERFASVLVEAGIPRMPARVFAALLATDSGRLTAAELSDQLQASPAAVSGGVRYLVSVGMISREGEPGSRRHHYRVHDSVWDEVMTGRDRLLGRAIGRGDQAHIDRYLAGGTHWPNSPLLDRTQQLALDFGTHLGDLVEKERASMRRAK